MRTISAQSITDTVARLCIKANTQLPQDVCRPRWKKAREEEPWPLAKNTLDLLWSNLGAAKEKDLPICQDTGMAQFVWIYLRLYDGSNYDIQRGYDYTIFQGIAWGIRHS